MIRVTDYALLYLKGTTNGKIVNIEMINDVDYQELLKNIKIEITRKD